MPMTHNENRLDLRSHGCHATAPYSPRMSARRTAPISACDLVRYRKEQTALSCPANLSGGRLASMPNLRARLVGLSARLAFTLFHLISNQSTLRGGGR